MTKLLEEREGFIDCRSDVLPQKKSGPISTCRYVPHLSSRITLIFRFNTRVDYVYQQQLVKNNWDCTSVHHIETDASDHYPVVVTFKRVLEGT